VVNVLVTPASTVVVIMGQVVSIYFVIVVKISLVRPVWEGNGLADGFDFGLGLVAEVNDDKAGRRLNEGREMGKDIRDAAIEPGAVEG